MLAPKELVDLGELDLPTPLSPCLLGVCVSFVQNVLTPLFRIVDNASTCGQVTQRQWDTFGRSFFAVLAGSARAQTYVCILRTVMSAATSISKVSHTHESFVLFSQTYLVYIPTLYVQLSAKSMQITKTDCPDGRRHAVHTTKLPTLVIKQVKSNFITSS